ASSVSVTNMDISDTLEVGNNIYANAFIYTSDFRLKTNINYINSSLDRILNLNGVSFSWKNSVNNKTNIGLIAQNVEKYFPEVVHTNNITGMKAIEYANLVAPLIESIKEQQTQIEKQQKIIENQQNQLDELRREIENLKISIN
ncbi:MAG: tail fiber domain-containing protein, partial [Nanoarchaeota archaeon]